MSDLIKEQLDYLRSMREQYNQRYNPEQQQQYLSQRNNLVDQAQKIVETPTMPQLGSIDTMFNEYLSKYAPGQQFNSLMHAIGNTDQLMRQREAQNRAQGLAERSTVINMREKQIGEEDRLLRDQLMSARLGASVAGKPVSPEQLKTVYNNAMNHYAQIAKDMDFTKLDPNDPGGARSRWILEQTDAAVKNYIEKFATQPTGPRGVEEPSQQPTQPVAQQGTLPPASPTASRNISLIQEEMNRPDVKSNPDKMLILQQELEREKVALENTKQQNAQAGLGNPLTQGTKTQPTPLETSQTGMPAPQQTPVVGGASALKPPAKDVREGEQRKAYGKEEGQELFKERKALDNLYGANSKLVGQLNLLENIYKNPNIPEGELAGQIAAFRSGMKSLGVEVSEQAGLTDLAKAVSTGLALTQRTADGTNLLPGAMSNYEDQLLQKMAPTLTLTTEGRLALIQFMKQVAQSNLRYAEEGTKMASQNKNMLPAEWYKRKERIMLEEMARMKMASEQLLRQYGGKR